MQCLIELSEVLESLFNFLGERTACFKSSDTEMYLTALTVNTLLEDSSSKSFVLLVKERGALIRLLASWKERIGCGVEEILRTADSQYTEHQ